MAVDYMLGILSLDDYVALGVGVNSEKIYYLFTGYLIRLPL